MSPKSTASSYTRFVAHKVSWEHEKGNVKEDKEDVEEAFENMRKGLRTEDQNTGKSIKLWLETLFIQIFSFEVHGRELES